VIAWASSHESRFETARETAEEISLFTLSVPEIVDAVKPVGTIKEATLPPILEVPMFVMAAGALNEKSAAAPNCVAGELSAEVDPHPKNTIKQKSKLRALEIRAVLLVSVMASPLKNLPQLKTPNDVLLN
jgi:hypothetical protein